MGTSSDAGTCQKDEQGLVVWDNQVEATPGQTRLPHSPYRCPFAPRNHHEEKQYGGGGEHGKDKQTRRSPREEKTTLTKTLNFESTKFKFRVTLPKTKFYLEENKVPWSGKIKWWFASLFTPSFYFSLSLSISPIFGIGTMRIQFGYRRVKMYSMLTHVERIWLPRLNVGSWKGL